MTILEKKVDAIARSLLTADFTERNAALAELKQLMSADDSRDREMSIAECIDQCLLDLGVPERVYGYRYLQIALREVVLDPELVFAVTKVLYPLIAKECDTTKMRVERAIRHAIETGLDRIDFETQEKYFGNTVSPNKGKPTNGEFIAKIASVVRKKHRGGVTRVFQNLSRLRSLPRSLRAL